MPKMKSVPRGNTKARRPDPDGEAWQAEANRRWQKAHNRARNAGDAAAEFFEAPPLPVWSAPPHVTRELLGRYLLDRDTGVVHDTAHALEVCGVDGIRNATFVHFAHELPGDVIDCTCMGGAS